MRGSDTLFIEGKAQFPLTIEILFSKLKSPILAYGGAKRSLQQLTNPKIIQF
jgi:hypothetical protein